MIQFIFTITADKQYISMNEYSRTAIENEKSHNVFYWIQCSLLELNSDACATLPINGIPLKSRC